MVLAGCLRRARGDSLVAALRRYEAIRKPRASKVQRLSRTRGEPWPRGDGWHLPDGEEQRQRDARLATIDPLRANAWLYGHDVERELAASVGEGDAPIRPRSLRPLSDPRRKVDQALGRSERLLPRAKEGRRGRDRRAARLAWARARPPDASPRHRWSGGERAWCSVPRNRGANTTLLASVPEKGMGTCLTAMGSTTREVFEAYVDQVLVPALRPGQIVVMDNLTAQKGEKVKELIERSSCELLYLPPYSPDFDPVEEAFSKIKALVRKVEARTREALVEAIGTAISAVSARDAHGFFEHCGYRAAVQPF